MIDNPYWDAVQDKVVDGYVVTEDPDGDYRKAFAYYAWTVSDPDSVEFVAKHCGDKAIDPFAGTGYWAYLLGQLGIDVRCYDLSPDEPMNPDFIEYHKLWVPVHQGDAEKVVSQHSDRTLLLVGPPGNDPSAYFTLREYGGDRVVFMGDRRSSGDDNLKTVLCTKWKSIAEHIPVQWAGWNLDDRITVYERNI